MEIHFESLTLRTVSSFRPVTIWILAETSFFLCET